MPGILLEAYHIKKSYAQRTVLDVDQIRVYDGERVALIGENGAGKTTLLSILSGEIEPDEGTVRRHCPFAIIHQTGAAAGEGTPRLKSQFNARELRDGLSGGELTRRRIADALSRDAPLLFADEPTTDLDAGGARRLMEFLMSYRGAIILVSHDRALLEALCGRVLHLEGGKIADFPGGYREYQAELKRRREFQRDEYERYRAEQARLRALAQQKAEWAASVKKAPKRMGNSEARLHTREYTNAVLRQSAAKKVVQNRLDRLEEKERPRDLPGISMAMGVSSPVGAKTILSVRCDMLAAGGRTLIAGCGLTLPTGSKTALMGDNGCGKTTLLRAIWGDMAAGASFRGEIRLNPGARVGRFDQDHEKALSLDDTALENAMSSSRFDQSVARTVLARLNIRGEDVFKKAGALSGGERAKIALAKLMLSDINLMILDEPTNHLDLFAMEALESLMADYGGTLLFVSHDRAFVNAVADRVLTIRDGRISTFEGNLDAMEADIARDRDVEAVQTEISSVEMRMAALAARLSSPKKGDDPQRLNAEYAFLAARLREMKKGLK